jgi:hypothetical protein
MRHTGSNIRKWTISKFASDLQQIEISTLIVKRLNS